MNEAEEYEEIDQVSGWMKDNQFPPSQSPGDDTGHVKAYGTSLPSDSCCAPGDLCDAPQNTLDAQGKGKVKAPVPLPPMSTNKMALSRNPIPLPNSNSLGRSKTQPNFPAIPPKLEPKLPTKTTPTKIKRSRVEDIFNIEKEELSPEKFIAKYSDQFPMYVRVSKGFYGSTDLTSVSEGDKFNIHFIKKTKVVNVEDGGGVTFKVPISSAIEFGILYDPNNTRKEALTGFTFEKVSDFLQVKNLPKVVRVESEWVGSSPESSVSLNELLIIRGWRRKLQRKLLKVYNPVTREKKELAESCKGMFSTRPYSVRLFLMDLIDHIENIIPTVAVLYINSNSLANIPSYMVSSVVKLKDVSVEISIVATELSLHTQKSSSTLEIPFDLDIEFQVMRPKEKKETEVLYHTTRDILKNFPKITSSSQYIKCPVVADNSHHAQAALYSIVREGKELAGVDIVTPSAIYLNVSQVSPGNSQTKKSMSLSSCNSFNSDYTSVDVIDDTLEDRTQKLETSMQTVETSLSKFEGSTTKMSREITTLRAEMKRMELRGLKTIEDATKAKAEVDELRLLVEKLKQTCASLLTKMDAVKQASAIAPMLPPTCPSRVTTMPVSPATTQLAKGEVAESMYSTINESSCQSNREFLSSLDFVQILNLLECMGLKKHQEAFMEERVNGEILLECDDEVLQEELKVTSKLQRSRLMKLIQGRYSAKRILQGEDPYVYARPK